MIPSLSFRPNQSWLLNFLFMISYLLHPNQRYCSPGSSMTVLEDHFGTTYIRVQVLCKNKVILFVLHNRIGSMLTNKEKTCCRNKRSYCLYNRTTASINVYGLSHHTLVSSLSGPCTAMAAFTFAAFTESSAVG